jgi:hypothetical protein
VKYSPKRFDMPSEMGRVMASLLMVVDAWYELARESAPTRFDPSARVEVLGRLVRLLAVHFGGFCRLPGPDAITPVLQPDAVGLRLRSPGPLTAEIAAAERELAEFGFRIERDRGAAREVTLTCTDLAGAQVIDFPTRRRRARWNR